MRKYKAIVSIEFDEEDMGALGCAGEDPYDVLFGELQNFNLGSPWIDMIAEIPEED